MIDQHGPIKFPAISSATSQGFTPFQAQGGNTLQLGVNYQGRTEEIYSITKYTSLFQVVVNLHNKFSMVTIYSLDL